MTSLLIIHLDFSEPMQLVFSLLAEGVGFVCRGSDCATPEGAVRYFNKPENHFFPPQWQENDETEKISPLPASI